MNLLDRLALGHFPPPVVACGRVGVGVAHELLHRHQVNPSIQQITGKGAAHVVGGKISQACLLAPLLENRVDGLVAQRVGQDMPPLADTRKERTGCLPAQMQPVGQGVDGPSVFDGHAAGLVALAAHRQSLGLPVEVGQLQRSHLPTPQTPAGPGSD
jgi:hypothetical protein